MTYMLWNILIFSVAVFLMAQFLPGVKIKSFGTAIVVAIVYGVLNFLIGWLLKFLALPFIIITFGLFIFVINAILLWLTDKFIDDFEIDGFGTTVIASVLITIISWVLKSIIF